LEFGAEVQALEFGAGLELGEADFVEGVWVVGFVVGLGEVAVVEEDASAGDAVGCPVVDAAAEVGGVAYEIGASGLFVC
jgi:hypothetical protein